MIQIGLTIPRGYANSHVGRASVSGDNAAFLAMQMIKTGRNTI